MILTMTNTSAKFLQIIPSFVYRQDGHELSYYVVIDIKYCSTIADY